VWLALVVVVGKALPGQSTTTAFAGVGLSIPAGDFGMYANNGASLVAGIERSLGTHPTALRLDLTYAVNLDSTTIGFHETTHITNALLSLVYHFQGSRPHLYAMVGVGAFHRTFSSDDPDDIPLDDVRFAVQLGEGVVARIGRAHLFLEGRFVSTVGSGAFRYFPVNVGVRF
jgi:hypothetical protein